MSTGPCSQLVTYKLSSENCLLETLGVGTAAVVLGVRAIGLKGHPEMAYQSMMVEWVVKTFDGITDTGRSPSSGAGVTCVMAMQVPVSSMLQDRLRTMELSVETPTI